MTAPTQFNIEAEGAAPQIEQKIYEILRRFSNDQVEAMGIFKGGWSDESMAVFEAQVVSKATTAKQAILQLITEARLDELSHIEPIPEAEPYLRFWWGEKNGKRDIAMTLTERIEELRKEIQ